MKPWFGVVGLFITGLSLSSAAQPEKTNASTASTAITPRDNYEQWKDALDTGKGIVPPTFVIHPEFSVETVYTARPEEGSWIALTFDQNGRAIIAREKQGLLRCTLSASSVQVEPINTTVEEARGLLYAFDSLYVNANASRGLFRLRDTQGNDRLDDVQLLVKTNRGGHGRNGLALGPDGVIGLIHGDSIELTPDVHRLTPPLVPGLLPGDNRPHGHFLRTDAEGKQWTLVASGLRNPVGVDFNAEGEAFTYDADAETDMGSPWYRPTHVRHLVSGADFGWRQVTGRWPPYYPDQIDNPPTTLVVGKGSPTAVRFGTRSNFSPTYQRALYIMDWSYGRIIAVHLTPQGASYTAEAETFLRGRPLNVTGMEFGPDGAMYFVTGGRNTQSALYRVRYQGSRTAEEPTRSAEEKAREQTAVQARALRRQLETFHGRQDPRAVAAVWPYLDHADPWIAHAARVALEHQPPATWAARALNESTSTKALAAWLALTRVGPDEYLESVVNRLVKLPSHSLSTAERLVFIRIAEFAVQRLGNLTTTQKTQLVSHLDPWVPHPVRAVNREAIRLLLQLDAPDGVNKAVNLLVAAKEQEEKLHYLQLLGRVSTGWTEKNRQRFFRVLNQTSSFRGGAGLPKSIREINAEALASVPADQRARYAAMITPKANKPMASSAASEERAIVKQWTSAELATALKAVGPRRSFQRGKALFSAAACVACHPLGEEGQPVGPDLTDVASRFSQRDLLDSILEPSRVVSETYRTVVVTTKKGDTFGGRLAPTDYRLPVLRLLSDPLDPERVVEIQKNDIATYQESEVSPMPAGLLDRFQPDEILDLLAYIEAGGDAGHPSFVPQTNRTLPR